MIGATALAGCCAAAIVWALTLPGPAVLRMRRMVDPPAAAPAMTLLLRACVIRAEALRSRRRERSSNRASVIELCDGLGAELAAGRTPQEALEAAAGALDGPIAAALRNELAATAPLGVEVAGLLEHLAERPGADGLRSLAACWRIGAERGGGFAAVIDGLAVALRDDEAQRAEVTAQLAGPRATARMLAGLPLLGLGMAAMLGADPVAFLLGTPGGLLCASLGIALNALGLWWTHRLAAAAEIPR